MNPISALFPESYEASRARFRENLPLIQERWPAAQLAQHALPGDEGMTIDWIHSPATQRNQRVFILTIGEHGIEGYVGSAMQQRFIEKYLPRLDATNTGLLFVHAINPWGMKHRRRTNANNVDLNRNFVYDPADIDPGFNPDSLKIDAFLHPRRPLRSFAWSQLPFGGRLLGNIIKMGLKEFRATALLGQYHNPQGIHYGGSEYQEETRLLMNLYRQALQDYDQILHLDMHTGYGPRYQMSLVNSVFESGNSHEFARRFDYPLVVAANPEEFYAIRGDMVDYLYMLWQKEFPQKRLYANAFEYGTYGDSFMAALRSMRTMVFENRAFCQGAPGLRTQARVARAIGELFAPEEDDWRAKAVADADQAFEGILKAEGFWVQ